MLFDIRTIVGALLGAYGIVLLVTGLVDDTAAQEAKTGGVNVNLWTGIALVIVSALFVTWVLVRPVQVPEPPADPEPPEDDSVV